MDGYVAKAESSKQSSVPAAQKNVKENHKNYDVIIVGGGHNGLVAAIYLAKAGRSVLLLEANDELGGATTSVKPFPEYEARLSR